MNKVFALDIGTRVVIGLVMEKCTEGYRIIASARTEHSQRAMYDGQVHDVDEVASAVLRIKRELESKLNCKLKKVAVAAAGRALCTQIASASRAESLPISWERQDILTLEMEAIQKAMKKTDSTEVEPDFFYCVGYSTIRQMLENQAITSLVGQRGKKAELTVIATFLPRTVVDGLVAVLNRAGLEMESLTLEPIAAGQAAIPNDMRNLNIALVDIGAGTSDIALTKEGTFFSYGMVPMAGDEITEAICSHYLLSFQEGEKVKKSIQTESEVQISNFFGEIANVSKEEILDLIRPAVQTISEKISQEILALNGKTPQAVILVGGGSFTPMLRERIAEKMKIPVNRVGIQERKRLSNIVGDEDSLYGPDVITPLGIAMAALDGQVLHFYSVEVNNSIIPIFELNLATVAEALLAAGIQPKAFLGRPGSALIYELNGEIKVLKGGLGSPAEIFVNGEPSKLDRQLRAGDSIKFVPGHPGQDAHAQIKDIIELPEDKWILFNGKEELFQSVIMSGAKVLNKDDVVESNSRLHLRSNATIEDFLISKNIASPFQKRYITINSQPKELHPKYEIWLNGEVASQNCVLEDGNNLLIKEKIITLKELGLQADPMNFTLNGQEFFLPARDIKVFYKGKQVDDEFQVEDGMEFRVEGFAHKPILSDLFPYLNLNKEMIPKGRLEMLINGRNAEFTTELNRGDRIVIIWIK